MSVPENIEPTQEHLDARAWQRLPQSTVESLVEVAHALQLCPRPRLRNARLVARELRSRVVVGDEALQDLLGGQHAGLDRQVDTLETAAVEEPTGVAREQ